MKMLHVLLLLVSVSFAGASETFNLSYDAEQEMFIFNGTSTDKLSISSSPTSWVELEADEITSYTISNDPELGDVVRVETEDLVEYFATKHVKRVQVFKGNQIRIVL